MLKDAVVPLPIGVTEYEYKACKHIDDFDFVPAYEDANDVFEKALTLSEWLVDQYGYQCVYAAKFPVALN